MKDEEYRWKGIILIVLSIICAIIGLSFGILGYVFMGAILSFYGILWTIEYIKS
jgi:hypothetical protein